MEQVNISSIFTIIQLLQSLWVAFIVIMLFYRFRIGLAAYLAYIFLVPYMKIYIGSFLLQWNFINILVLIAFFIHRQTTYSQRIKYDWRPILPFIVYFGGILLLMLFQDGVPFSYAINAWRKQVLKCLILAFVIWNDVTVSHESLKLYRKVTIVCIIIMTLYGLFLTTMPGVNPYMMIVSAVNGESFNMAYAAGYSAMADDGSLVDDMSTGDSLEFHNDYQLEESRLFGRISSVFSHPMTFGLFLGLSILYLYRNRNNISRPLLYLISLIIMADIIVCGVRSVIAAMLIVTSFLLLYLRKLKLFFILTVISCILWITITNIPELYNYIGSIFDDSNSHVSGSSWGMRLSQLKGCFIEIQNTILAGKGYGWTGYYLSQNGAHPTMLHFESLFFVVLCNSGILGLTLWLVMGSMIVKNNNKLIRTNTALLHSLFVFYVAYACITGDYGYMQYYIVFYILMLGEDIYLQRGKCIS